MALGKSLKEIGAQQERQHDGNATDAVNLKTIGDRWSDAGLNRMTAQDAHKVGARNGGDDGQRKLEE